jgi:hypothetical protein
LPAFRYPHGQPGFVEHPLNVLLPGARRGDKDFEILTDCRLRNVGEAISHE